MVDGFIYPHFRKNFPTITIIAIQTTEANNILDVLVAVLKVTAMVVVVFEMVSIKVFLRDF
jgi:hypothetical protein